MISRHAPFPLSKIQNFELLEYFRFEVEYFYPFIPFDCLASLAGIVLDSSSKAPDLFTGAQTEDWGDMSDCRNLDLFSLLLACALASKRNRETKTSRELMVTVCGSLNNKMNGPKFDLKDIAIATFLVSFLETAFKHQIYFDTFQLGRLLYTM